MNIYIVYEVTLRSHTKGADFTLGNSLFRALKISMILTNINILDMVLDLMHAEVFPFLMVAGLVKM